LQAHFGVGGAWIEVNQHRNDRRTTYDTSAALGAGHGGGDHALLEAFLRSVIGDGKDALSLAEQALESHLLAFAAETARLEGKVIDMEEFRRT
jgi:hypothetical protein